MNDAVITSLASLAEYLAERREQILQAWRAAARADPAQTTSDSLTRTQFNDHIPAVLNAFERKLRSRPGSPRATDADASMGREEVKHGLQRWQQGYTQLELMREWGQLHLCLFDEIERYAALPAGMTPAALAVAHRELAQLVNEGISESALQYARMERSEAAGMAGDLEKALATVKELERRRAALIHQAVHDLRGNIQSVASAADVLRMAEIAEADRVEFATLLQQGVETVASMLGDLLELSRLEAGHENRQIAPFDAAHLVKELQRAVEPMAVQRRLYLKADGPESLLVEGDAGKVRRLVQNLVLNALKYTQQGGVTLTWGEEKSAWWVMVKDTGPGLLGGPGTPLAIALKGATVVAHEADEKAPKGDSSHVLDQSKLDSSKSSKVKQSAGEGIGLSIVKRLCELLDASVELTSSGESGTTFRVMFPRKYQPSA
ncbi:MAG: histidine kinase [Verrucomicrobia bacterium]|nr:histidine kinase [Verrucomicrobiota bacterium]